MPMENRSKVEMTACSWSASLYVPESPSSLPLEKFGVVLLRCRVCGRRLLIPLTCIHVWGHDDNDGDVVVVVASLVFIRLGSLPSTPHRNSPSCRTAVLFMVKLNGDDDDDQRKGRKKERRQKWYSMAVNSQAVPTR